mmetsp:Transcript_59886/g.68818  ORF Transcript_59886/g.68818 Transcript_59886/m.68818 type:complete len:86 (+) Transcript_59886:311-568(+)
MEMIHSKEAEPKKNNVVWEGIWILTLFLSKQADEFVTTVALFRLSQSQSKIGNRREQEKNGLQLKLPRIQDDDTVRYGRRMKRTC